MAIRADAVPKLPQLARIFTLIKSALDGLAGYIPEKKTVTLPAAGWMTDGIDKNYPVYQDVTVTGVTTNDRADVEFPEALVDTANACGVSPVTTITGENTVRVRAVEAPEAELTATVWIIYGKGN